MRTPIDMGSLLSEIEVPDLGLGQIGRSPMRLYAEATPHTPLRSVFSLILAEVYLWANAYGD